MRSRSTARAAASCRRDRRPCTDSMRARPDLARDHCRSWVYAVPAGAGPLDGLLRGHTLPTTGPFAARRPCAPTARRSVAIIATPATLHVSHRARRGVDARAHEAKRTCAQCGPRLSSPAFQSLGEVPSMRAVTIEQHLRLEAGAISEVPRMRAVAIGTCCGCRLATSVKGRACRTITVGQCCNAGSRLHLDWHVDVYDRMDCPGMDRRESGAQGTIDWQ